MSELRLTFATRDMGALSRLMIVGYQLNRFVARDTVSSLRIHLFEYTNSNGDEKPASVYAWEALTFTIEDVIKRLKLPLRTRRDGLDLIVERA